MPRMFVALFRLVSMVTLALGGSSPAWGQCDPVWQPFDPSTAGLPGISGTVAATATWDPDGPGPLTPKLVLAGSFNQAGGGPAQNIVAFDEANSQWLPIGAGIAPVTALAVLPNGELVAASRTTDFLGAALGVVVRWSGSAWLPLGATFNGEVLALAALPNGHLVAGGRFRTVGGNSVEYVAQWDGLVWSAMSSGMNSFVHALAVLPSGEVVAGGEFTSAGGVNASRVARWNGSAWSRLGSGVSGGVDAIVKRLAVLPSGELIAAGKFTSASAMTVNNIARWTGLAWSPLGSGITHQGNALAVLPNGNVVAGSSSVNASGNMVVSISNWNGSTWSPLQAVTGTLNSLATLPSGQVVAAGDLRTNDLSTGAARWNGEVWMPVGPGLVGTPAVVNVLETLPSGDLIAGGGFRGINGASPSNIIRWNGSSWSPVGSGMSLGLSTGSVNDIASLPSGEFVAAGAFTIAGGVSAQNIARWNGSVWSILGSGLNGTSNALAVWPNGNLAVGGRFSTAGGALASNIAQWNGSVWSRLGSGTSGGGVGTVNSLVTLPNGDLIAGGGFNTAGGIATNNIAKWNGSVWSALGSGVNGTVYDLAVLPNGDLVAASSTGRVARWNGLAWFPLGTGFDSGVFALEVLPNGHLIAGGGMINAGGTAVNGIARWDGTTWSPLGSGIGGTPSGAVTSLKVLPSGDLVVGGSFTTAGGVVAPSIARWGPPRIFVTDQPDGVTLDQGQTLVLAALVNPGLTNVSVQWQRNGVNITDGFGGASSGGGTVMHAAGALPSPTIGAEVRLIITGVQRSDAGMYTAVFTNPCGSVTSNPAAVNINGPCPGDFNGVGGLTVQDIFDFLAAYFSNDPRADVNSVGGITVQDIFDFLAQYFQGC